MTTTGRSKVKVVCRFRPSPHDDEDQAVKIVDNAVYHGGHQPFAFDNVFGASCGQEEIYDEIAGPIVKDVIEGFNATILAYGQTSSGKTHTMTGDLHTRRGEGIIPRAVTDIFKCIEESEEDQEFTVRVAHFEIYMERLRDLLADDDSNQGSIRIREDKRKGVYVEGLAEQYVSTLEEVMLLLDKGALKRKTASTNMNEFSSRSHAVFQLELMHRNLTDLSTSCAKLVLVDLAGSEKVSRSGASGLTLAEANNINVSLSTLGKVIYSLTDGKSTHVPYRDSKLTRVLQESIGGNSRTVLVITASSSPADSQETLSTLRFGTRAKKVKNRAHANKALGPGELQSMLEGSQRHVLRLQAQVEELTQSLAKKTKLTDSDEGHDVTIVNLLKRLSAAEERAQQAEEARAAALTYSQELETALHEQSVLLKDKIRTKKELERDLVMASRAHHEAQREVARLRYQHRHVVAKKAMNGSASPRAVGRTRRSSSSGKKILFHMDIQISRGKTARLTVCQDDDPAAVAAAFAAVHGLTGAAAKQLTAGVVAHARAKSARQRPRQSSLQERTLRQCVPAACASEPSHAARRVQSIHIGDLERALPSSPEADVRTLRVASPTRAFRSLTSSDEEDLLDTSGTLESLSRACTPKEKALLVRLDETTKEHEALMADNAILKRKTELDKASLLNAWDRSMDKLISERERLEALLAEKSLQLESMTLLRERDASSSSVLFQALRLVVAQRGAMAGVPARHASLPERAAVLAATDADLSTVLQSIQEIDGGEVDLSPARQPAAARYFEEVEATRRSLQQEQAASAALREQCASLAREKQALELKLEKSESPASVSPRGDVEMMYHQDAAALRVEVRLAREYIESVEVLLRETQDALTTSRNRHDEEVLLLKAELARLRAMASSDLRTADPSVAKHLRGKRKRSAASLSGSPPGLRGVLHLPPRRVSIT